jgi:hypothetical protein
MSGQQVTARPPREILRKLADLRVEPKGVLSLYVDLDLSLFPTPRDRHMEIDALVGQAASAFVTPDLSHDQRASRSAAIERLRTELDAQELAKNKTRSTAVFVAPDADLFEVLRVGHPVAPSFVVDVSPYLRPLANDAGPRTWAVLLVDRRRARLLYGGEHRLIEVLSFEDDTPSHQKQGGWRAERNQRHADEHADEHIDKAAGRLFGFWEQTQFDALTIAAPDPTYTEVVASLHSYLEERFKGRVTIEIATPNAEQVLEAAMPVFDQARESAVGELLDKLNEASRQRVAFGPRPVFDALFERRIDTLIVEDRFAVPGVRCPECDWLGLEETGCPFDGIEVEQRPDVIDDAVDLALVQAARVVTVDPDAERRAPEPISALLRY